jgi:hypothetical protein
MRPYLKKTNKQTKTFTKNGAGRVTQVIGPEFKPQHAKKKKKNQKNRTRDKIRK